MLKIPIVSRLKFSDYVSLTVAIGILIFERIIRICLFLVPYSIIDHFRYKIIGILPRVFKGCEDEEEISDLKRPMVRFRNAKEIVEHGEHKYKLEEHAVFTPEGYIILLHRLKFNERVKRKSMNENTDKDMDRNSNSSSTFGSGLYGRRSVGGDKRIQPPVLLNHGAMMTSEAWLTTPTKAINSAEDEEAIPMTLPHVLLHAGYDVWLNNRRGNKYSCKHTSLSTHSQEFWSFSLDEPACRDIPAVIDFIREETGYDSVSMIGFSQGAAETLGSLSMVRGLQDKVNLAVLLAPTTKPRVNSFKAEIIRTVVKMSPEVVFLLLGRKVMLGFVPFWQRVLSPRVFVYLIDSSMKLVFGWHCTNMTLEDKIIFYQHLFAYTSVKQIVHWFQIMRARNFQMFDEGPSMRVASGHLPPTYPLHQIKTPLALFDGTADSLHDQSLRQLPALIGKYTVDGYEHLDFMWAESVHRKVWPIIVKLLNQVESKNDVVSDEYKTTTVTSITESMKSSTPPSPPVDSAHFLDYIKSIFESERDSNGNGKLMLMKSSKSKLKQLKFKKRSVSSTPALSNSSTNLPKK